MFLQRKDFLLQLLFERFRISHPRCSGIYTPMFKKVPRQGTKVPMVRALLCPSEELFRMVSDEPKLYIERNGGRYSLLSAVNIEGSLNIVVSLPKAGEYTLRLLVMANR